jgi:hypothetical protein
MPKNILGTTLSTTYHGSSAHKIFGTAGELHCYVESVVMTTAMVITPSTLTAYGVSYIMSTGTQPTSGIGVVYLPAPIPGVEKTIIYNSTAAGGLMDICLSTGTGGKAGLLGTSSLTSTEAMYIHFSSLVAAPQSITLIGLSTQLWAVKSICGNYSTANANIGFGHALGIRASTAVRTS